MEDSRIPIYLITGFLDSGKTTLLIDTLGMDYFNDGQRSVLVRCEDGEVEYDPQQLSQRNCRMVTVEEPEQLNHDFLAEIDRRYQPERVLFEYNGMWPIQVLRDLKLPKNWGLYQAIHVIDGTTFEMYRANMASLMMDAVSEADIVFEDAEGEELEVEDILPYDLNGDHIQLEDDDYGIWYLDIQDAPEKYTGKTITFKALAMTSSRLPKGTFIPGRNAMTCCEEDVRFFGFLCKYDRARTLKKGAWVTVTAKIAWEYSPVYTAQGVVLYAERVEPADPPADPMIYFR